MKKIIIQETIHENKKLGLYTNSVVDLKTAEQKETTATTESIKITNNKTQNAIKIMDKQINKIDNHCGDLSIGAVVKKQSYIDARKLARKKLKNK